MEALLAEPHECSKLLWSFLFMVEISVFFFYILSLVIRWLLRCQHSHPCPKQEDLKQRRNKWIKATYQLSKIPS